MTDETPQPDEDERELAERVRSAKQRQQRKAQETRDQGESDDRTPYENVRDMVVDAADTAMVASASDFVPRKEMDTSALLRRVQKRVLGGTADEGETPDDEHDIPGVILVDQELPFVLRNAAAIGASGSEAARADLDDAPLDEKDLDAIIEQVESKSQEIKEFLWSKLLVWAMASSVAMTGLREEIKQTFNWAGDAKEDAENLSHLATTFQATAADAMAAATCNFAAKLFDLDDEQKKAILERRLSGDRPAGARPPRSVVATVPR